MRWIFYSFGMKFHITLENRGVTWWLWPEWHGSAQQHCKNGISICNPLSVAWHFNMQPVVSVVWYVNMIPAECMCAIVYHRVICYIVCGCVRAHMHVYITAWVKCQSHWIEKDHFSQEWKKLFIFVQDHSCGVENQSLVLDFTLVSEKPIFPGGTLMIGSVFTHSLTPDGDIYR